MRSMLRGIVQYRALECGFIQSVRESRPVAFLLVVTLVPPRDGIAPSVSVSSSESRLQRNCMPNRHLLSFVILSQVLDFRPAAAGRFCSLFRVHPEKRGRERKKLSRPAMKDGTSHEEKTSTSRKVFVPALRFPSDHLKFFKHAASIAAASMRRESDLITCMSFT